MLERRTALAVGSVLLLLAGCRKESAAPPPAAMPEVVRRDQPAATPLDDDWAAFRRAFPFHVQVIALSGPAADGTRTLIVSEPPPHVAAADVLAPLAPVLRRHRMRKDGDRTDLVAAVAGAERDLAGAIGALYRRLFFTSYKAYVLPLPVRGTSRRYELDLGVTTAELRKWIIADAQPFSPVEGGAAVPGPALFDLEASAVYRSNERGLVTWWVPSGAPVDGCRPQARQFALDSDLILGAIVNAAGTLVVGRERIVPVDLLPPLGLEMMARLASSDPEWGARGADTMNLGEIRVVALHPAGARGRPRPMAAALRMPGDPLPDATACRVGWRSSLLPVAGPRGEASGSRIAVERRDGIYLIAGDGLPALEAYERAGLIDAIVCSMRSDRGGEPLVLELRNFEPGERAELARECQAALRRPVSVF